MIKDIGGKCFKRVIIDEPLLFWFERNILAVILTQKLLMFYTRHSCNMTVLLIV